MSAHELYAALKEKGYVNAGCESTLAASRRVARAAAHLRRRTPDPVSLQIVTERRLRDALELDRLEAFHAWFGDGHILDPQGDGAPTPAWKANLVSATYQQLNGDIPRCIDYLEFHC